MPRFVLAIVLALVVGLSARGQTPAAPAHVAPPPVDVAGAGAPPEALRGWWLTDLDRVRAEPSVGADRNAAFLSRWPVWVFGDDGITLWTNRGPASAIRASYATEPNGEIRVVWGLPDNPATLRFTSRDASHVDCHGLMRGPPERPLPMRRLLGPADMNAEAITRATGVLRGLDGAWRADRDAMALSAYFNLLPESRRARFLEEFGEFRLTLRNGAMASEGGDATMPLVPLGANEDGTVVVELKMMQAGAPPGEAPPRMLWILRQENDGLLRLTDLSFREVPMRRDDGAKPAK